MDQHFRILLVKVLIIATVANAANILICLPYTSKSHYIMSRPIGLELAKRGHNVTVLAPFKEDVFPETYHQITTEDIKIWNAASSASIGIHPNFYESLDKSMPGIQSIIWNGGLGITENVLKSKNVQEFLSKDNTFDLVINEVFAQEAFFVLAHKYNAHQVLLTTFGNSMINNFLMRNPMQLETLIYELAENHNPASFFGRLTNFYYALYYIYFWNYWYLEKQENLVKRYIKDMPQPVPSLQEINRNASLVLINSHFSYDVPAAYLPNIVEVGGLHIQEINNKTNNLPNDLQEILDKAKHGVVYVNFGTNVYSSSLPEEKKNTFLNVFRKLKQTVIWKWEDDSLIEKPKNVITRKWLPQVEILAHPNVKVFISHGGLIGTHEALFYGVPIIGMPAYADQYNNLLQIEEAGHGKILQYEVLNERNLDNVLNEFLTNDRYSKKAKEVQRRFKDRPMKPLDTAVYWIEYVMRNNGAHYLKNPAMNMSWIQYSMLDVYAFFLVSIIVIVIVTLNLILFLLRLIFKRKADELLSINRKNK